MSPIKFPIQGSCGCGHVRYQLHRRPIFTQCCHCQQCQREAGSAFAINALIEANELTTAEELEHIIMPSESGHGQAIARCPRCRVALWSYYSDHGPHLKFLRVATLDRGSKAIEELLRPEAFIFIKYKMQWNELPEYAHAEGRVFDEYYDERKMYSEEAYARFQAVELKGEEWRSKGRQWDDLGEVEDLRR
ncbi:hypothetical protein M409DRAFT_16259 [Zasmidium cellare ATCC 36951]|uniref:CENP-V/GFA domain-containing protein n=1 Tax=Zasmidium cellare ATCC 36951 TaxID=1080233 RepID=A0A6A6D6D4_ZASCE|nr:uncharacterized protein M409DRAFT_16259 [Zasmidium cellare ATCC 36951]KAF2173988.1 hypothetical protein M409DRAFT_16259 [Zasmidium cellare ATCC 36951]